MKEIKLEESKAKYIIRMDDACSTMRLDRWDFLENLFDKLNIKPIVAVVPDNIDKALICEDENPSFWSKVASWQDKGWTIGLHGYQHDMHPTNTKQILPIYNRSEFSGLSFEEQSRKIRKGYDILKKHGITPTVWIAPAHCFNKITLKAIFKETPIRIVSDGIAFDQYFEHKFFWIPQQLWHLTYKKRGLWTICMHPNGMSDKDLESFKEKLLSYKDNIISLDSISFRKKRKSLSSMVYSFYFWKKYNFFRTINDLKSQK